MERGFHRQATTAKSVVIPAKECTGFAKNLQKGLSYKQIQPQPHNLGTKSFLWPCRTLLEFFRHQNHPQVISSSHGDSPGTCSINFRRCSHFVAMEAPQPPRGKRTMASKAGKPQWCLRFSSKSVLARFLRGLRRVHVCSSTIIVFTRI